MTYRFKPHCPRALRCLLLCLVGCTDGSAAAPAKPKARADDPQVAEARARIERLQDMDRDTVADLERARLAVLEGRTTDALEYYETLLGKLDPLAREGHNLTFGTYAPLSVYGDLLALAKTAPAAKAFVSKWKEDFEQGWVQGDQVDTQTLQTFIHLHGEDERGRLIKR